MVASISGEVPGERESAVRDRRLMPLGVIGALGETSVLPVQLDAALPREELTPEQLREIAIFLSHYVGWPRGAAFNNLAEERIAQHGGAGGRQRFPGPKA